MKVAVRDLMFYSKNGHHPTVLYASTPLSLYSQLQSLDYCEPRDCMFLNVAVSTPTGDYIIRLYRVALSDSWAIDPDDFNTAIDCDMDTAIMDYTKTLIG